MLKNGLYRTRAGSTVRISGEHSGIYEIAFDWVEEGDACADCVPSIYGGYLSWHCGCGGGCAELFPVEEK